MQRKPPICCILNRMIEFCLFLKQTNRLILYSFVRDVYYSHHWKRGRAVEGTGLENRRPERVLEFESLRFRHFKEGVTER